MDTPGIGSSASSSAKTETAFGDTEVVEAKRTHLATIVWLHGLGDNSTRLSLSVQLPPFDEQSYWKATILLPRALRLKHEEGCCRFLPLPPLNIGFIPSIAQWFDVQNFSKDESVEELDAVAERVSNILAKEPSGIRLGIGGFSMGAAVSLYSATCFINGMFANGKQYPIKLNEIVSLSGWIPCSRFVHKNTIGIHEVERRAASLRILLCHDREDMIVPFEHSQEVARRLIGFGADVTICNYTEHGHHPDFSEKGPGYVKRWLMV